MTESIVVSGLTRKEKYESLIPQIEALIRGENDTIANLCNIVSALQFSMNFFWTGIYFVKDSKASYAPLFIDGSGETEKKSLVLGPFQGPPACTRIAYGKGVCGKCWEQKETIIVNDVDQFPGHIACSSLSKSEIAVPVFNKSGDVILVLDIDSLHLADFNETDKIYLQQIAGIISRCVEMPMH